MNAESLNREIKKVVSAVKEAREKIQDLAKTTGWVEEARKYAQRQRKEVIKLIETKKIHEVVERQRKELERIQKQIPAEVKKIQKFVKEQQKELKKLVKSLRKTGPKPRSKAKSATKRASSSRKRAADGTSSSS